MTRWGDPVYVVTMSVSCCLQSLTGGNDLDDSKDEEEILKAENNNTNTAANHNTVTLLHNPPDKTNGHIQGGSLHTAINLMLNYIYFSFCC